MGWKEKSEAGKIAGAPNYSASKPKPLFRGTRLLRAAGTSKPYRVLVSAWREMGSKSNEGGCRIDVYYPPTSQCWSLTVSPKELEEMAMKMDASNSTTDDIDNASKGGSKGGKGGKNRSMKHLVRETAEEIKLRKLIEYENCRLLTLIHWAPERAAILNARQKRHVKQMEEERLEQIREENGEKNALKPTPPGRRQLEWICSTLKLNRHPVTSVVVSKSSEESVHRVMEAL